MKFLGMHNLNTFLFTLINQGAGYWSSLDYVVIAITSYIAYGVCIAVVGYFICIAPFRTSDMRERLRGLAHAGEMALSLGLVYIIVKALKLIVAHPRPFESLVDVTQLAHATPLESFPSMHAALTIALAISVLPYRKHLGHLLITFSFIVAISRLYVGVHYPFDVGVGLLIGYLIPKLIHRIFSPR